ncbi:MAG: H/ACA ribonucleoprotein complex subunit GAR1 [Candidatus Helarchaeota archaeon]
MRRINRIQHVSNQRHLITRVTVNQVKQLKIGQTVVTKDLNKIGKIFDIFGPINNPYISIKLDPTIGDAQNLIGEIVYVFEGRKMKRGGHN